MKQYLIVLLLGLSLNGCDFPDYYWEKLPECDVEIVVNHLTYLEQHTPKDFRYTRRWKNHHAHEVYKRQRLFYSTRSR